ncbi:DinB family protein [Flectobacillus major]|uniref:DinB family protein n=1 Tax=Flectobacillus major TaxID=103 RepID=UPI00040690A4|nr:DinB family protein [Flectobacillus major]
MQDVIHKLYDRIILVQAFWEQLSEEQRRAKASPEKWSIKEVLGHLVDSAQTNIRRLIVGQYQAEAHIVYQQNHWVQAADYQHYDSQNLMLLWVLLNKHFAQVLNKLPTEKYGVLTNWGKNAIPKNKEKDLVSLELVAYDYIQHLDHHLRQMGLNI